MVVDSPKDYVAAIAEIIASFTHSKILEFPFKMCNLIASYSCCKSMYVSVCKTGVLLSIPLQWFECDIDGMNGWKKCTECPLYRRQKEAWRVGGLCVWFSACEDVYLQLPQGVVTLLLSCCLLGTERDQLVNTLCHSPETHRQTHRHFSPHRCPFLHMHSLALLITQHTWVLRLSWVCVQPCWAQRGSSQSFHLPN